ncbi:HEPN domain-containing protein [candidate division NPL-UPA2 bacterium Unc8]|uniref:HEPN domain-containing protein n=2 Tax=Bacteria TaxID=2 RepID=A0A9E2BJH3_PSYF1|nr:hypothetical protein [Bacillota bacterium]MBT9145600.1 hypothetical protein [Candidatus Psychracetigena formicireducens]RIH99853.1 MAG: HEPN domain-containing protein [candidate division NPL-UPA2 bacterium Unc8]
MRKKLVEEWIYKAEEDFESALYLVKKRKKPIPDVVCFHSQQCIEKYLKAFLVKNSIEPPEIHDLQRLNRLCGDMDKNFNKISDELDILNAYAINFRYPGEKATIEESRESVLVMRKVREFIRRKVGI